MRPLGPRNVLLRDPTDVSGIEQHLHAPIAVAPVGVVVEFLAHLGHFRHEAEGLFTSDFMTAEWE